MPSRKSKIVTTSTVAKKKTRRPVGRPRKLSAEALREVEQLMRAMPQATLNERLARIHSVTGVRLSITALKRYLRELGFVRVVPPRPAPRQGEDAARKPPAGSAEPQRYGYDLSHRTKAAEATHHHGLSDAEWAVVADIFEDKVRGMPRKHSRRAMVDAMTYVVRGGVPWRLLPKEFPPWLLVFKTFQRWSRQGRFERMYDRLRSMWREREGRTADPTAAVIDSQSVRTSAQGGPKGFDAAKKVKGRKRHLLTDTLGLLLMVAVQTTSTQDRDGADEVVAAGLAKVPGLQMLFADAAYAGQCKQRIERSHPGLRVEIARHPANRAVGIRVQAQQTLPHPAFAPTAFVPLPKRWVIERTNAWNDRPRRLAKDQERTTASATAWLWFAEGRRLLRRVATAVSG